MIRGIANMGRKHVQYVRLSPVCRFRASFTLAESIKMRALFLTDDLRPYQLLARSS